MKRKFLLVVKGIIFVAEVVMTLFNLDMFSRFCKERIKMKEVIKKYSDENYQKGYEAGYKDRDEEGDYLDD